ncbi:hypothetical protein L210DRAFT_2291242 [Boletus edulis BED1]|uniref:Uncharacterized protein n=1 Tax=Boletus edulis BED1 TaxID=1328754 RepID=A0AAD4BD87_BOLED|nr:hypothetical protein L210DRAFT_2291242 [Boletus edulis BED1]
MRRQPDCHVLKNGQLEEAEALLTEATLASQNPHHHVLASRAIVRARLRQWGAAIEDGKKPIEIQPSIGILIRRATLHSNIVIPLASIFLLIKAVIVYVAGERYRVWMTSSIRYT